MPASKKNFTTRVRKLYDSGAPAKRLFDELSTYQNNVRVSHIDNMSRRTGLPQVDVRGVFASLEQLDAGRLVLGRHGNRTRFCWSMPMTSVVKLARPQELSSDDELTLDDLAEDLEHDDWLADAEASDDAGEPESELPRTIRLPLTGERFVELSIPHHFSKEDAAHLLSVLGSVLSVYK